MLSQLKVNTWRSWCAGTYHIHWIVTSLLFVQFPLSAQYALDRQYSPFVAIPFELNARGWQWWLVATEPRGKYAIIIYSPSFLLSSLLPVLSLNSLIFSSPISPSDRLQSLIKFYRSLFNRQRVALILHMFRYLVYNIEASPNSSYDLFQSWRPGRLIG